MSAETLRRAAALMRERAEAATPAPWQTPAGGGPVAYRENGSHVTIAEHVHVYNAEHIASWHPAVALAVADWLDDEAVNWQRNFEATQQPSRGVDQPPAIYFGLPESAAASANHHARHALSVARAYLGESA